MLISKIFEEVLEVDSGEVCVDEGEDDPVWVAELLDHFVHLHAEVTFPSSWVGLRIVNTSNDKCIDKCGIIKRYSRVHQLLVTSTRNAGIVRRQILHIRNNIETNSRPI